MKWSGHVVHMGEGKGINSVLVGKSEGREDLEDLGIGGKVI